MLHKLQLIFLICLSHYTIGKKPWEFNGTTPMIKEILIGRCWQYQILVKQNKIDALTMDVNCTKIWEKFHSIVAFKDGCTLTKGDFKPFFDMLARDKRLKDKVCNILLFSRHQY